MKLFKSMKDNKNWIEKSEEQFLINLKDMLKENEKIIIDIEEHLRKNGLSINKILKKNSIETIYIDVEKYIGGSITFYNNVELIDALSLVDLIINLIDKDRKESIIKKINLLLTLDLDGMYLIENGQIIEKEGLLKIKDSTLEDNVKKLFLDYYNPINSIETKKEKLREISNVIENFKKSIKKGQDDLVNRNLNKSLSIFSDIVNNIDGIRHSGNQTQILKNEDEKLLMDLAINTAYTLIIANT